MRAIGIVALSAVALCGCSSGKRDGKPTYAATPGSTTGNGGSTSGGSTTGSSLLTGITPDSGPSTGGTLVRLAGQGYAPGTQVTFDGVLATDVTVISANELTCRTPPHAPAVGVDVEVTLPAGTSGRLNNAFTYTGDLARVADYGDPTGAEQEILERMNAARRDPTATGQRLGLDFSAYPAKPPFTHNQFLGEAAGAHTGDMHQRSFYGHSNPDGVNANGRILSTAYDLHAIYGTDPTVNLTESIGAAYGDAFNTPQRVVDAFLIDANVNPPKHRDMILGKGAQLETTREAGVGFLINQTPLPGATPPLEHFATIEVARTVTDRPFILGVAYTDDGDGLCEENEGQAGVPVTLSHASGFTISTHTQTAGGYAFEVLVPGTYTIDIGGQQATVTVQDDSVKVDLRNGQAVTY